VVEGDGPRIAEGIAGALDGAVAAHSPFGTAQVRVKGHVIDIATARKERYPYPGALPVVTSGTLAEDLNRRDFTVHAMACGITPDNWDQIIDPCGGRPDLDARLLRVLHERSFVDDPTRMVRAVRYGARLRFSLEERTEELLHRDRLGLAAISGARRWKELRRLLEEDQPERALLWADRLDLLQAIHPALAADPWLVAAFIKARSSNRGALPVLYFCLLAARLTPGDLTDLVHDLQAPASFSKPARDLLRLQDAVGALAGPRLRPSEAVALLEEYSPYAVRAMALVTEAEETRERLTAYLSRWSNLKPRLSAERLIDLGVPRGPELGVCLNRLRAARVDGETRSAEDEVALVTRWLTRLVPVAGR
jgi:tRNA nucleotidyltransferase (CCA-adding enzyme)